MKPLSTTHVHGAGLAAAILLTGAAYALIVRPVFIRQAEAASLREVIAGHERERADAAKDLAQAKGDAQNLTEQVARTQITLHSSDKLNARLAEITRLAADAGITLDAVTPGERSAGERFSTVPIRMSGTGSFPHVTDFLARIHTSYPDLAVEGFSIAATVDSPENPPQVSFHCVWYAAPAGRAAAPAAPPSDSR